jgi:hypothetical protein
MSDDDDNVEDIGMKKRAGCQQQSFAPTCRTATDRTTG